MGELGYIRDKLDVKFLILFVLSCLCLLYTSVSHGDALEGCAQYELRVENGEVHTA